MNITLLAPRQALRSLVQHRLASLTVAAVFALMVGSTSVFGADTAAGLDTNVCTTTYTKMDITGRGTAVIYGTAEDGTPGTLFLGEVPLSSIRHITDAERASGKPIWITGFDSTVIEGWRVDIYWQNNYYDVHVVGEDGTFVDDTGAACVL